MERLRFMLARTALRKPLIWMRHRTLRPEDVVLASYPRSGNTWLRFLLFQLLTGQEAQFRNVMQGMPEVGRGGKPIALLSGGGRIFKSHETYQTAYRRAIYLIRDPRDVALSEYRMHLRKGFTAGGLEEFIERFVAGNTNPFGAWHNHIATWISQEGVLWLRFEDLSQNAEVALERVLGFLGVRQETQALQAAIEANSLQAMRNKENAAPPELLPAAHAEHRFIQWGSVGGWRRGLNADQVGLIEQHMGATLARTGYPLNSIEADGPPEQQAGVSP